MMEEVASVNIVDKEVALKMVNAADNVYAPYKGGRVKLSKGSLINLIKASDATGFIFERIGAFDILVLD